MSDTATAEPVQTLAEYKAERLAPPEPVKEPGEVVGEATEVKDEPEAKEEEKEEGKSKLQGRFSELTRARKEAEQRAEREAERASAAERERDELKAKLEPKAPEEAPKPKAEDYADAFEFAADLAEWTADRAVKRDRQERIEAETKAKADAESEKVRSAWNTRLNAAKKDLPDWEDTVAASEVQVSDPVRDAIIESEHGPEILYLLASEPEIAEKLSKLTILGQLREIGKLEAKYEKQPEPKAKAEEEKPRPRAPAPIVPVKGAKTADNPSTSAGEFKGTFAEWKAARQSGRLK